jgi:hypothetical protein
VGERREIRIPLAFTDQPRPVGHGRFGMPEPANDAQGVDLEAEDIEIPVTLTGLRPSAEDDVPLYFFVELARTQDEDADVWMDGLDWNGARYYVDARDRARARQAMVHAGPWLASHPTDIRNATQIQFELEPAGLLVVLPGRLKLPAGQPVTIERVDGGLLPHADDLSALDSDEDGQVASGWTPGEAHKRVRVKRGTILGPLPAGPVRLRLRQAGFELGTLTAQVVPSQLRPIILLP